MKILIEVNDERSIMFVMKNYKVVNVYSGYGEMSINGVDEMMGESLKEVCIELLEEKKDRYVEDCEEGEKVDLSYFEEFVNCWGVEGKIGSVGDGEEGYDLVFEEGSEWFEKVDKYDDWNDKEWDEWDKLNCEGLKFSVDGKI